MSIEIKIIDPQNMPPMELRRLADYLRVIAGDGDIGIAEVGIGAPTIPEFLKATPQPPTEEQVAAIIPPPPAASNVLQFPPLTGDETGSDDVGTPGQPSETAAAMPAGLPSAGPEVDSAGLPWDARIHAETKAKIGNGTWRYKRNVDKAVVAQVEAELRGIMNAPAAADVPTVPPAPVEPSFAEQLRQASTGPLPPPPPAPVAGPTMTPPPPAPVAGPSPTTFAELMAYATPLITLGKLPQEKMTEIVMSFGLPHVGAIFQRQDLVPQIFAAIEKVVGAA